ncbi:hypothetical protein HNP92_001214 [Methanococcus maripaludis]|uniref:Uncharacterized protein n=1 Tax=Methanococcus maripaludis TaxID=39152 RepID=A0A7J9S5W2_METMI|nr:hypothetical protein [Methanococcus maripaludis]MBB6401909.1 hypothetical protein [Methanococcus maripaludis]
MIDLYQYKVAWCPFCDQGWVVIAKELNTGELYLFCEECELEWDDPKNITKNNGTRDKYGRITLPSIEDIREKGWEDYIIKDPYMCDAKILEISDFSEDKLWNEYAENMKIGNYPVDSRLITFEVDDTLLTARGAAYKKWMPSMIGKSIKINNYFVSLGNIEKTELSEKGIFQIKDNVYSITGDILEMNENGMTFVIDCGNIITLAKRYSGLNDIKVGDRVHMDIGEYYIYNMEFEYERENRSS